MDTEAKPPWPGEPLSPGSMADCPTLAQCCPEMAAPPGQELSEPEAPEVPSEMPMATPQRPVLPSTPTRVQCPVCISQEP